MICFIPDLILMCKISFTPISNLKFTNTWTLCNNNPLIFHFLPFFFNPIKAKVLDFIENIYM